MVAISAVAGSLTPTKVWMAERQQRVLVSVEMAMAHDGAVLVVEKQGLLGRLQIRGRVYRHWARVRSESLAVFSSIPTLVNKEIPDEPKRETGARRVGLAGAYGHWRCACGNSGVGSTGRKERRPLCSCSRYAGCV